jgi:cytochrome c553
MCGRRQALGLWVAVLATLVPGMAAFAAGDPARGREVAALCASCHGRDGVSPSPSFPILAGQHAIYLASAIRAYRDGQRSDAVMGGAVRTLTDQQIEDVAAWYASQSGLAAARPAGEGSAAVADASASAGAEAAALTAGAPASPAATILPPRGDSLAGCPVNNPNIPETQDSDRDGLPDRHDAVPADASEFVKDSDADGWFEICDIRQLQAIRTLGEGPGNATGLDWAARAARRYRLVRDLDAGLITNFQPIGDCGPQNNCMIAGDEFGFTGSFDGGEHVIRRLRIDRPETGGVGLFGVVARSGVIRDLVLEDAIVSGLHGVGALVGANFGLIQNCRGKVQVSGRNATGGLVGGHAGRILGCETRGSVSGQDAIGGLVGDMRGFVASSSADTGVSGRNGVGGLLGLNTVSTLVSSYATGRVSGRDNVGGLVGVNTDAVVADSFATAAVEATGTSAGGLVGFNSQSRIRNSYARGAVRGAVSVGGLVGTNNGQVRASYATGKVTGKARLGGLAGDNSRGRFRASYWDRQKTGRLFGAGHDDNAPGGAHNNEVDPGENNSLAAYGKTTAALRVMGAAETGWHPAGELAAEDAAQYHCDANGDGRVGTGERRDDNLAWDFAGDASLPGLRCVRGGLAIQSLR